MNRRGFLRTLIGGVAATAAVRTFPFRVYSFPAEPVVDINALGAALEDSFFTNSPLYMYFKFGQLKQNGPNQYQLTNITVPTDEEVEKYSMRIPVDEMAC